MRYIPFALVASTLILLAACSGGGGDSGSSSSNSSSSSTSSSSSSSNSSNSSSSSSSSSASSSTSSSSSSSNASSSGSSGFYAAQVETPVVQSRCVLCHVDGGLSGHTRLVFSSGDQHANSNEAVFENFVGQVSGGANLILNKVRGVDHGGGAVFSSSDSQYQNLETFLNALDGGSGSENAAPFYDKILFEDATQTLRRAALLFAARLPTEAEENQAAQGDSELRQTLRNLMQGDGFHQFILRGANDRLLTDAFIQTRFLEAADSNAAFYPALANRHFQAYSAGQTEIDAFQDWMQRVRYGVTRAPLELIAHIVENDRPYTEILTADYTMINPATNVMYNANLNFENDDINNFKVGINGGQIIRDQHFSGEFVSGIGTQIFNHGDFIQYPHAGILNEPVFLNRYPSTATNRNRARSRWTYYHFLDVDIEKSAARTTDPDALADTNNPTMNNPNCTVCHQLMDPVAGAYQHYGDVGRYKESWGGRDSLPEAYKNEEGSPYIFGDTWFRDMRTPGFNGEEVPASTNSLQWLAEKIIQDERFARATVKFWWQAIMSDELKSAPENSSDAGFNETLRNFEMQNELIETLARDFRSGSNGSPYNLKDLFVEMVMSDWFRARASSETLNHSRQIELDGLGQGRLLTPEELENKTRAIIGFAWGETEAPWTLDGIWSNLNDRYRIYYGGIDSDGITERAKTLNSLMSNVAEAQATSVACPTVVFDFNRSSEEKRLFTFVDRFTSPVTQARQQFNVTAEAAVTQSTHVINASLDAGEYRLRLSFDNPYWDAETQQSLNLILHEVSVSDSSGNTLLSFNAGAIESIADAELSLNESGELTGTPFWDANLNQVSGWHMWQGYIDVPLTLPANDTYQVSVSASKRHFEERSAHLGISVNTQNPFSGSTGETAIRQQLQLLHKTFWGENEALSSTEINASYDLLVELWQLRQTRGFPPVTNAWNIETCAIPIDGWWQQDRSTEFSDPMYMQGAWVSVLIYLLTDYQYLHE